LCETKTIKLSLLGTPYETLFRRPRVGLEPLAAYKKHMTQWIKSLESLPEPLILYYFDRLKNLKFDSLSEDEILIDHISFPVFFTVDSRPRTLSVAADNFERMLITTRFPLVPASMTRYLLTFSLVEEPLTLPWLTIPPFRGKGNLSMGDLVMESTTLVAMREKQDGRPFIRFSTLSGDYLLGSFWMPTVMCVDQAEFIPSTCRFYVLYPSIPAEYEENRYIFKPHPFVTFNSSVAQTYREGVMVLISRRGEIEEVRVKRENTVELQVVNKKICFNQQEVPCADGVWEMALRGDLLVPVRARQMKDETTNVYSKLLAPPNLDALLAYKSTVPSFFYKCVFGENERIVQDAPNSFVYQTPLKYVEGVVVGNTFSFESTVNQEVQTKEKKKIIIKHTSVVKKYTVADFFPLSLSAAFITSEPKEVDHLEIGSRKGVAILHFQGDEVGVVTEGNKLYTLPGGKIEYGEDVIPALTRELREELPLGWVQIETVGPLESGLCSYFVALQDRPIPGVMYVPLTDVRLSPWIIRVVNHFRSINHVDKVLDKHVFRDDRIPEQFFGKLDPNKIYYYPDLNKEDLLPLSSDWIRVGYYLVQRGTRFSKYVKCQDAVVTNAEKDLIKRLPLLPSQIEKITGWGSNLMRQKMHSFGCVFVAGMWGVG